MSNQRQATQRKNPSKKGSKRQNNSSNVKQSNGSVKRGPMKPNSEYAIAPSAISRLTVSSAPKVRNGPGGTRILKFKEYVQDIAGSVAFSASASGAFPVNPGMPALFAWLSTQAVSYQEFKFRSLRFIYETEKSTATSGKVMFAFQQDSTDPSPASKQELLENQYKEAGAAWQPFVLNIGNKVPFALGKQRFVRIGALASNLDQKTYDLGQLIVATQGMADTSAVGELYVEYEIDLMTPLLSIQQLTSAFSKVITGVSPSNASLMGTTPTTAASLDVTATGNTLTFNRVGRYIVEAVAVGTVMNTAFTPVTSASTGTVAAVAGISNAAANAGTTAIFSFTVVITSRGQTAVFDCTTQCTTLTSSTVRVAGFSST